MCHLWNSDSPPKKLVLFQLDELMNRYGFSTLSMLKWFCFLASNFKIEFPTHTVHHVFTDSWHFLHDPKFLRTLFSFFQSLSRGDTNLRVLAVYGVQWLALARLWCWLHVQQTSAVPWRILNRDLCLFFRFDGGLVVIEFGTWNVYIYIYYNS